MLDRRSVAIELAASLIVLLQLAGCGRQTLDPRLAEGKQLYERSCASCHLPSGEGKPGVGPSLVGSSWVKGSPERLVRISLYGVRGPIEVNGEEFNLEMPGVYYYHFDDEQMAAILSYIRAAWGNDASLVSAELVAKIREATGERDSWTVAELAETDVGRQSERVKIGAE